MKKLDKILNNHNDFWNNKNKVLEKEQYMFDFDTIVKAKDENEQFYLETAHILRSGSDRRFYVCFKINGDKSTFLGTFSNQKLLLGALYKCNLEGMYIKGKKSDRKVNKGSINTGFVNRCLKIYQKNSDTGEEELVYKILENTLNRLNPKFMED